MSIRCKVCKEDTGGKPGYSFYGHVHKWGPTTHKFVAEEYCKVAPQVAPNWDAGIAIGKPATDK